MVAARSARARRAKIAPPQPLFAPDFRYHGADRRVAASTPRKFRVSQRKSLLSLFPAAFPERLRLPIGVAIKRTFAQGYDRSALRADVLAGIVVGIVALPLSMALAIAVGVPPQHGLYTAIVAGIVAALAGGSKFQVTGPTAAFVVILAPIVSREGLAGLLTAGLFAGFLLFAMGVARLGRLIQFIPHPVTTGFTAGIATVIATLQIKDLLALPIAHMPETYLEKVRDALAREGRSKSPGFRDGARDPRAVARPAAVACRSSRRASRRRSSPSLSSRCWRELVHALFPEFRVATIGSRFRIRRRRQGRRGHPAGAAASDAALGRRWSHARLGESARVRRVRHRHARRHRVAAFGDHRRRHDRQEARSRRRAHRSRPRQHRRAVLRRHRRDGRARPHRHERARRRALADRGGRALARRAVGDPRCSPRSSPTSRWRRSRGCCWSSPGTCRRCAISLNIVRIAPKSDVVVLLALLRAHRRLRHGDRRLVRRGARGAALHAPRGRAHALADPRGHGRRIRATRIVPGVAVYEIAGPAVFRRRAECDGRHRQRRIRHARRRARARSRADHRRDRVRRARERHRPTPSGEEARGARRSAAGAALGVRPRELCRSTTNTFTSPKRSSAAWLSRPSSWTPSPAVRRRAHRSR